MSDKKKISLATKKNIIRSASWRYLALTRADAFSCSKKTYHYETPCRRLLACNCCQSSKNTVQNKFHSDFPTKKDVLSSQTNHTSSKWTAHGCNCTGRTINEVIFSTHTALTVCMQHFFDFCLTADRIWSLQFSIFVSIFCSFWSSYSHILILLLQEFRDPTMAMDWSIVGSNPGQAMGFFKKFSFTKEKNK